MKNCPVCGEEVEITEKVEDHLVRKSIKCKECKYEAVDFSLKSE